MINSEHNNVITLDLIDEKASEQFAAHWAFCLTPPLVVALSGDIGTGKTTIVRAMLKNLGVKSAIKSPTFSLVESYICNNINIHHFDLYRIHHEDELEYLGFRDYFSSQSVCLVEWAEHAGKSLPQVDIRFNLSIKGAGREMQIQALSVAGKSILDLVNKFYLK
ncbi:tRNA (adenosine(37)-N6)-threonylcarbamoyltransferase complex ATPase subunit type 1 TsaE [Legionella fallonii]|uniref:tRNA threonylcarbamoyladenosine biosynthesis protein TsaE n=1 Tax=Legionella fallonii LLAP-10 TaxID=1212491 RepID=A0A098G1I1_9GAMM|nr:tRNA (adenosine(37)-N6)-threonylcarbamoyltransferase complex ATPase subunit type 1 TsaE [Legionella fallonii]CEG55834.1 ATPase with strong ADP affinity [Legionella fallonii LLAP-10]